MTRINNLPTAAALTGSELIPFAQWSTNVKSTLDQVLLLVNSIPVNFMIIGQPAPSQVYNICMPIIATLPSNFSNTTVYAGTTATADTIFLINQISGGVTTAIGSLSVLAGSSTGYNFSQQSSASFSIGDILQLVAQTTQDITLANISITLLLNRT